MEATESTTKLVLFGNKINVGNPLLKRRAATESLEDLGDEILLKILQCMQPTAWDLCRMACVNKTWKSMCYGPCFWKKLRIGPGAVHPGKARSDSSRA